MLINSIYLYIFSNNKTSFNIRQYHDFGEDDDVSNLDLIAQEICV